jgi:Domain of unknown function (DUF4148)
MTKSIAVVALALAAAGAAYADDPTIDTTGAFVSTKTRAEVQAERLQVKRDVWSNSYNPLTMTRPAKTRNRVLDELEDAQHSGQLRAFAGEDSGSAYLASRAPRRTVDASRMLAGTPPVAQ